jgi:aspartyl aminopeptidase
MAENKIIDDLLTFLNNSPTSWHAVENVKQKLVESGFQELQEKDAWYLSFGGKYFIVRNGSSIIAFQTPTLEPTSLRIVASHTDSPSFKLKSNPEFVKDNMVMLGLEVYGGPLISSWLNRDLKIAGRVFYLDKQKKKHCKLVDLEEFPVVIPQLAIHLDRQVNENGLLLNKQEHLSALAALDVKGPYLEKLLKEKLHAKSILSFDLILAPTEKASLIGYEKQMIASYRIDSLLSVHACLKALIDQKKPTAHELKAFVFFDHEEVGSTSTQGADSPFLSQNLERIMLALNLPRENYFRLLANGLLLSVDLAHAVHPNYKEKHEPNHQAFFNRGIVIKQNANLKYASNAYSTSHVIELCVNNKIPYQHFVSRNDMPCGSTIGPLNAGRTGIETVDIGVPQLSMHSCRELAAVNDHKDMCKLLTAFLK